MSPYCARAIWTDLRRRCFTNRVRDNHGHHTFDKACTKKTARCTKYIHCFERSCHVLSIAINCVNEAYQSLPAFTMPYLWISWKFMEYLWSEHILAIWAYLSYGPVCFHRLRFAKAMRSNASPKAGRDLQELESREPMPSTNCSPIAWGQCATGPTGPTGPTHSVDLYGFKIIYDI